MNAFKSSAYFMFILLICASCGEKSNKKRNLDETLYKYAAFIRFSEYDAAMNFLKPNDSDIQLSTFEMERLKQFKVSSYNEYPIQPTEFPNKIAQSVRIKLYNIHTNQEREIFDTQVWEFNEELMQWFLVSGLPKLK